MPQKATSNGHEAPSQSLQHIHYPFWFGGSASCFSAAVTHPLDLLKVRLQTRASDGPRGLWTTFVHIVKNDTVLGLYRGLSASILRQLTYSTTRFGVYSELKESLSNARSQPSLPTLVAMASASGFLGGVAGNPADVLNVRMQNDQSLPPAQRRNYRNVFDGLIRMTKEEGWSSLFRGVGANSTRAVLMTASQLASYDYFKQILLTQAGQSDTLSTHLTASFLAGFVATTICSPVDVIKTRIMSSPDRNGLVPLIRRIVASEGFTWIFRGWVPSFIRLGPHTIVTFLALEQHKVLYRRLFPPKVD